MVKLNRGLRLAFYRSRHAARCDCRGYVARSHFVPRMVAILLINVDSRFVFVQPQRLPDVYRLSLHVTSSCAREVRSLTRHKIFV